MAGEGKGIRSSGAVPPVASRPALTRAELEALARDVAIRVAGANHGRRLYGQRGQGWARTLAAVMEPLGALFEAGAQEVTLALLGDGLAVQGLPVTQPPSAVVRFVGQLKARDVEIISLLPGVDTADLEVLFEYLGADAADVAAMRGEGWLRERGVERVRIKHLKLVGSGGMESFRDVYLRGRRVLGRQFQRAATDGEVSVGAVGELARALMDVVLGSEAPVATLMALRDRDDYQLVHSVNVATLVGVQAEALGLDEAEVQVMVTAALTHDIGKTRVPEAVLTHRGPMGAKEQALLDRHAVEGARLLLDASVKASLPAVVAQFHHAVPDPGLPGLLAVELCRVADVFDGVRTLVGFHDAVGMQGAATFMWRRMGDRFNPYLLQRFARLAGVGAAGAQGWLDTGEVVRVLAPHPELAFSPKVEVLDARDGPLRTGAQVDLAARPDGPTFQPVLPAAFRNLAPADVDGLG